MEEDGVHASVQVRHEVDEGPVGEGDGVLGAGVPAHDLLALDVLQRGDGAEELDEGGELGVAEEGRLVALVELERVRALPGHDELDEEVGEGRVEELRQLGLEVVRGLADPDLRKTEGNGLFKDDLKLYWK